MVPSAGSGDLLNSAMSAGAPATDQALRWIQWLMQNGGNAVGSQLSANNDWRLQGAQKMAAGQQTAPQLPGPGGDALAGLWNYEKQNAGAAADAVAGAVNATAQPPTPAAPPAADPSAPPGGAPPAPGGAPSQAAGPSSTPSRDNGTADYPGRSNGMDRGAVDKHDAAGTTNATNQPAGAAAPPAAATTPTTNSGPYDSSQFPAARDENVYGLRDNDTQDQYGRRLLQQGLSDSGNNLLYNPATANSPWASFLMNRYSGDIATKMATGIASGGIQPGQEVQSAKDLMHSFATGGGSVPGGVSFDDLRNAANAFQRYAGGDTSGMNTTQTDYLKGHMDDYGGLSNQFVDAARATSGGWGTRGAQLAAQNLYDRYSNDPSYALQNGPFAGALLKQIGAA